MDFGLSVEGELQVMLWRLLGSPGGGGDAGCSEMGRWRDRWQGSLGGPLRLEGSSGFSLGC